MTDDPHDSPDADGHADATAAEPSTGDRAAEGKRIRRRGATPAVAGAGGDAAVAEQPPRITFLRRLREYAMVIVIAVVLAFLVKSLLVQPFWIPSGSMEDTLIEGDRIIVNKLPGSSDHLERGDVVVFQDPDHWLGAQPSSTGPFGALKSGLQFVGLYPAGDNHLVKRIIGLPGDHVVCCDQQGRLTINGVSITEPYLRPGEKPSVDRFNITVPPGRMWVMGDNRGHSFDSRGHDDGTGKTGSVPESDVTGKVTAIVWPLSRFGTIDTHHSVFAKVPNP